MPAYTFFSPSNGEIAFNYEGYAILDMISLFPDMSYISGKYEWTDSYVDQGIATPRPEFSITVNKSTLIPDGIDFIEFNSIPSNCSIQIKGLSTGYYYSDIATSPQETFSTNVADSYVITISKFPYINFQVTIDANS